MKRSGFAAALAALLSFALVHHATLKADELSGLQILNTLAYGGLGQFKYKIGGEPGGEDPNLDDSDWGDAYVGFKWDLPETNVWFRTRLVIPEKIGGFRLAGRDIVMHLNIDNGGIVYVNGQKLGEFEWDQGHFVIARDVKPGQRFVIAILGINHPGYGKIYDARIEFSGLEDFQKRLQREVWKLFAAKKLASKFTDNAEHWHGVVDEVVERALSSRSFRSGDEEGFIHELRKQMEALRPLGNQLRQKYRVYCAGYAHIDLAWLWTWRETVEVVRATTQSVFNIMRQIPQFKYTMTQAHAYKWLEDYYPDIFDQIRKAVREGRWEIAGGMWVEPDCNLPSGESFVRQLLYGKRYFREKFGTDVKVCWIPDSFGFNWNLPQFLARAGIRAFVTHKINWNDTNKFPYRFFWWQAPDSSRVLAYIPRSGYGHDLNGDALIDFLYEESKELGFGKELVLYGVGNHGGGPTMKMLERALLQMEAPAFPDVRLSTSKEFFDSFSPDDLSRLPIWNDELYLEYHRGTYTSQARIKKHNRTLEYEATLAEKLSAVVDRLGLLQYPKDDLDEIWRTILFHQFHDILPGSSIRAVYVDAEEAYQRAHKLAWDIIDRALDALARVADTRGPGRPVFVFNPSSWPRTGPATLQLDRLQARQGWYLIDANGKVVPSQKVDSTRLGAKLLFIARDVPPLGYRLYFLRPGSVEKPRTDVRVDGLVLANSTVRVETDRTTGLLRSLQSNGEEFFEKPQGNLLQLLPNEMKDAWNLRFVKPPINLDSAATVEVVEWGPVRVTVHVRHQFLGEDKPRRSPTENFPSSFFDQYISVYAGLPFVEVRNRVEWWETHKVLKVAFPVSVHSLKATYEIPYATIQRSTGFRTSWEKARFEVPGQRWVDVSAGNRGFSLINDCKYGYDVKGNIVRLTLLRSPTEPDPMCDRGYHSFRYFLYPHRGDWREAGTVRLARELNEPFVVRLVESHGGELPGEQAFAWAEPENVIIGACKQAEDSNRWVVRLVETHGRPAEAVVHFAWPIARVEEINLVEDTITELQPRGKQLRFRIGPHEIRTFAVSFKK